MPPRVTPTATVALVGDTPAMLADLRPAAETLTRFDISFVERASANAFADQPRAVIVASGNGMIVADDQTLVIRVPNRGNGSAPALELLTGPDAWPAGPASFATMAIGEAGARNAALLVVAILALDDERLRIQWEAFRAEHTAAVLSHPPFSA